MRITYRCYKTISSVPKKTFPKLLGLTHGPRGGSMYAEARDNPTNGPIHVAYGNGEPVGWNMVDRQRRVMMYVHRDWRRGGIAVALLGKALARAKLPASRETIYYGAVRVLSKLTRLAGS